MNNQELHKWLQLDLATRQSYIHNYFATGVAKPVEDFISLVKAPPGYGVYASIGPNYQYAVFGRDSIEVAEDLLDFRPELVKEIIVLLAHLQGTQYNQKREEEPGKIHHEYRALHLNHTVIPRPAQIILDQLASQWGGTKNELLYYGSYDSTPLFIRLVHRYCARYGSEILNHHVRCRSGQVKPLRQHVREATGWVVDKVMSSPWHMLEFKRLNPLGLYNQNWQDSNVSFLHLDGAPANADGGIASLEIQGYVYDALRAAADIVSDNPQEAAHWRRLATTVRDNTLDKIWDKDNKYFAMGLDRDQKGNTRQIKTLSSNAGLLLETTILDHLPPEAAWPYIEGIVRRLATKEFITPAGIRVRAKKHAPLVPFADYHGSMVSWPKQTYDIAKGLRIHGFVGFATLLEQCILHAIGVAGEFYEFFLVDTEGRVKYHYRQETPEEPNLHFFGAANLPDPGHGWTISAVTSITERQLQPTAPTPPQAAGPAYELDSDILMRKSIVALQKLV